ncbi:MAG: hypothetical protein HON78_04255 [Legionellales bacterium]|nr:hypothetical protein [Legionellales bacterium]
MQSNQYGNQDHNNTRGTLAGSVTFSSAVDDISEVNTSENETTQNSQIKPDFAKLIEIYKSAPFQVISKGDVEKVKAARSFYADIGWGNWVAALGIAAGSITPLMAIGIPGWAIGAVLVIGTIFWRETNFEGVRGRISTQFAFKNPGEETEKVRDKKLHKFHALAVDALNDASNKGKSEDEQIELLGKIINSEAGYHIQKQEMKKHPGKKDNELQDSVVENIRKTLENSDITTNDNLDINVLLQEFRELLSSNTGKLHTDDFKIKVLKDRRQKQQRSLDHNSAHPNGIRNVKLISGQIAEIAASFGNGFGCFVAGLTTTGFLLGLVNVAFISPIVPLAMGALMAYAGYWAYKSNTVPAITGICKSFYYDYLDVTRPTGTPAEKSKKAAWWRKPARSLLMVTGVISSICMGCAIGTFNYQFGIFLVAVYLNPALLTSTAALATLAGPTTLAGMVIGATSGILVAIGTTCLFLRYITEGLTNLVAAEDPGADGNQSKWTSKDIFDMCFSLSVVALVTLFSVYSVKYYVVSSLPAALQQLGSIAVWLTGSIVYVCQAQSVVSNFLVNYGDWFGGKDVKNVRNCEHGFAAHTFKQEKSDGFNTAESSVENAKNGAEIQKNP